VIQFDRTRLVDLYSFRLSGLMLLDVYVVINIVDRFVVASLILRGQNVSDNEKQQHTHSITNPNDNPGNVVSVVECICNDSPSKVKEVFLLA
jgi:hypothetical protein